MGKNKREEDMSYRKVSFRQILLLIGVAGIFLWVFGGAICGCGSNDSSSSARQDKKPVVTAKPKVKELPPKPLHKVVRPQKFLLGQANEDIPVIPPSKPGGRGMTAAEYKAQTANVTPVPPPSPIPPGQRDASK